MQKVLIIGSNFGSRVYLKAINKIYKVSQIDIVSPNIYKKIYINKKINKFKNYKELIKKKTYDLIICAANPKVQNQFLKYSIKILKNKKTKLMLEKPLSENFNDIFKNFNELKKNNIIFNQNFIFVKIKEWNEFIKNYKKENYLNIDYTWNFKQAYFKNNLITWKTNMKKGGGILLFYMPHTIFSLLNLNHKLTFSKVKILKKTSKILTKLEIDMKSLNKKIKININTNSKNRTHSIFARKNNNFLIIQNNTTDWTKGFKYIYKKKIKSISKESRVQLTVKNIEELMHYKINSQKYNFFLKTTKRTYQLLNLISKKIYE